MSPSCLASTLAAIALGIFLYWCAMRWPKSRFGQRPLVFLLTGFSMLIADCVRCHAAFTCSTPCFGTFVGVMVSYIWFFCYALTDRTSKPANDLTLELTAFRPLWGSTGRRHFPKARRIFGVLKQRTPSNLLSRN